MTNRDDNRIH